MRPLLKSLALLPFMFAHLTHAATSNEINSDSLIKTDENIVTLIMEAWSYPEYQQIVGVNQVTEEQKSCYLSEPARQKAFMNFMNLVIGEPFDQAFTESEINKLVSILITLPEYFYYRAASSFELYENYSSLMTEQQASMILKKNEVSNAIMELYSSQGQVTDTGFLGPFFTLFGFGPDGIVMPKTQRALLDNEVLSYCKSEKLS